jgi:four helix bundle protein
MMNDEFKRPLDLPQRTKSFALRIIRMYTALKRTPVADVIGKQVLRSGTSVGAQYREAMRARSKAEFCSKTQCCIQELDETSYWLDLLAESGEIKATRLAELRKETDELLAILVASVKTARRGN